MSTLLVKPKYAPTKVSGTDTQSQSAKRATKVEKGTAAELPSPQRTKSMTKNKTKTILK